jgi:glutathione synthase/RimK-type ligase-like ATP-grasp enzyme
MATTWQQDVAEKLLPHLGTKRRAAEAEVKKNEADSRAAKAAAAEQAEREKAREAVKAIQFKNGGQVRVGKGASPYTIKR